MNKIIRYSTAFVLAAFGFLTLFLSSSVIFDWFGIRAKEGNYVLFIVVTNFICSLMYLPAAYGLITKMKWTPKLLGAAILLLIVAFIGLQFHINAGGLYETKTVYAMMFRTAMTTIFAAIAYYTIVKQEKV